jgi:four helix bundle protein
VESKSCNDFAEYNPFFGLAMSRYGELSISFREEKVLSGSGLSALAEFPHEERFGLTNQMHRTAVSSRSSRTDYTRFVEIVTASLFEVVSQSRMLSGLRKSLEPSEPSTFVHRLQPRCPLRYNLHETASRSNLCLRGIGFVLAYGESLATDCRSAAAHP